MNDFWQSELTDEEADRLIAKAVEEISKRKLHAPSILFLEMHKPLGRVMGNAAVVFAPFLVPVLGFDTINDYSRLVTKREWVERLIRRIEEDAAGNKPTQETPTPCSGQTQAG